ncbi:MAG: hypothetical protein PHD21_02180 [Flavobacteriales bacterium]|nr:hypothetical protein [Flavobacteriales bacterium]
MKKVLLTLIIVVMAVGVQARTNIYDLRSFSVNKMPLYLTAPDRAAATLGEPIKREGYLNRTGGYPPAYYAGMYPWGAMYYRYPMYMSAPELLATMVFIYNNAVIYFDQQTMYGSAFINSMSIYSSEYVLHYGDKDIKVGDAFSTLSSVFQDEYAKALKKSKKELFDVKIKVDAGYGDLRQKGRITFVVEKGVIVAIGIVLR